MIRTAESVSPAHPDKICDRIADAILDACLEQDPYSRVAIEVMGGHELLIVMGELTTQAKINNEQFEHIVRSVYKGKLDQVLTNVRHQSPEIAQGVDTGGAGDQGIMIGYATNETPELMPLEVILARNLNRNIYEQFPYDGKTQVTMVNGVVDSVVASFQNIPKQKLEALVHSFFRSIHFKYLSEDQSLKVYANPAGDWQTGGFDADTGLTGRKIVVDNYGPRIPTGGGSFSGKDATKMDRAGAYMARRIAVNYLRKYRADEVYCYLAYAIGKPEPIQATVTVNGAEIAVGGYDLTPQGIRDYLKLHEPKFLRTAEYGHFGNGFIWEA